MFCLGCTPTAWFFTWPFSNTMRVGTLMTPYFCAMLGALVDVELVDGCLCLAVSAATSSRRGREHLARTAPRGEEVHENGTLRIKHLGLEIGRRNDLAHVKASFVGAARISHPRQFLFASYCKRVCSTVHQIVTVRSMNLDIPDIFAR